MLYFWLIVIIILNTVWLAFTFLALPGNWLMVVTTCLFAWLLADNQIFSIYLLIAVTLLAVIGELFEFIAGRAGAKKAGSSRRGAHGALFGGIVGAVLGTVLIPLPLIGTLLGMSAGAGLGAWLLELTGGGKMRASLHVGIGAIIGQLTGSLVKIICGVLIWLSVGIAVLCP